MCYAASHNSRPHVALDTSAVKSSLFFNSFLSLSNYLCNKQFNSAEEVKIKFDFIFSFKSSELFFRVAWFYLQNIDKKVSMLMQIVTRAKISSYIYMQFDEYRLSQTPDFLLEELLFQHIVAYFVTTKTYIIPLFIHSLIYNRNNRIIHSNGNINTIRYWFHLLKQIIVNGNNK